MRIAMPRSILARLLLLPALAFPLAAAPRPASTVDDQDAISIRGIFDFQLPKIIRPESLRFTFNPMIGDFVHKDYVRVRLGTRYAVSEHLEVSAEVVPFIDNFGGGGSGGAGLAEYRFGTKLAWHRFLHPYVDTAFGATVAVPAPGAPEQLTIGTTRFNPYVAFSRDLKFTRGLGAFLNVGCEIFDSDPAPGRIARYRPSRDNLIVAPGVVLHRAPWHYTLTTSLRSTVLDGGNEEYFSVLPSVSFEVPPRWFPRLPGRVVVGGGYEAIFFQGEVKHRINSRIRWDFDWAKAARDLGHDVLDRMPWRNDRDGAPVKP
jgi:hypothetical protein